MALLQPSEYDQSYFDGRSVALRHNAGYGQYERWYRFEGVNSTGEIWKDRAKGFVNHLVLANKKVLEIGCAKGFLVKDLRDMGVDAYGLDVSLYALNNAEEEVKPYLYLGDAKTDLSQFARNEFDVVLSRWFLECLDPNDIQGVISEMGRIGKNNVHVLDPLVKSEFYTQLTIPQWQSNYNWPPKTTIINFREEWSWLST